MSSVEEALAATAYASECLSVVAVNLEAEGLGEEAAEQVQLPWSSQ